jgi:hypothetical protein
MAAARPPGSIPMEAKCGCLFSFSTVLPLSETSIECRRPSHPSVGQRQDVALIMTTHGLSERHACELLEVDSRSQCESITASQGG